MAGFGDSQVKARISSALLREKLGSDEGFPVNLHLTPITLSESR